MEKYPEIAQNMPQNFAQNPRKPGLGTTKKNKLKTYDKNVSKTSPKALQSGPKITKKTPQNRPGGGQVANIYIFTSKVGP